LGENRLAVKLDRVSTYYFGERRPAITDISLKIPRGSLTLIIGPNGSGKTTLLETILGLLAHKGGRIEVLGHELPRHAMKVRRRCGYLPQDFMRPKDEPFLAKEVVAMGLASNRDLGRLRDDDWRRVYEVLELLGIEKLAEKPIGKLSGGQQQKMMLARALVRSPDLLLLDEPFSAMDEASRRFISEDLLPDHLENGCTILMVSHDVAFKPREWGLMVRLEQGRVKEVVVNDLKPNA